jgi:hypothetical protein
MGKPIAGTLVPPSPDIKKYRLIVTGHDENGQSVFLSDQTAPHVMTVLQTPTYAVTNFWKALTLPADNSAATAKDPCQVPFVVAPPTSGCVFRVVEFPPDHHWEAKVAAMGGSAPVDETAKVRKAALSATAKCIGRARSTSRLFCRARFGRFWMWARRK